MKPDNKSAEKENILWRCPRCKAPANAHGSGECGDRYLYQGGSCSGFICECESEESDRSDHGTTYSTPCLNANCYHCGWQGKFPALPKGLLPWEKKALAAGWSMPRERQDELAEREKGSRAK